MSKVLLPIGDATEVLDTLYPYFRLPEDDFAVVVAGPEARTYHGVLHEIPPDDRIPWDITREQPAYHIQIRLMVDGAGVHEGFSSELYQSIQVILHHLQR